MKIIFNTLAFCLFSITCLSTCNNSKNYNPITTENMKNIEFIPKEFHDVELDLYDHKEYPCTPGYPEVFFESNIILINIPKKIIYKSCNVPPIIPLCAIFAISQKRALKYNHLSTEVIYIKRVDQKIIYSGEIVDPNLKYEHPIYPPNYYEEEEKREKLIKEAQTYSDEELDEGLIIGNAMNINLLEYVDIPLSSGKYEIYLSCCGLESNRAFVEIVIE